MFVFTVLTEIIVYTFCVNKLFLFFSFTGNKKFTFDYVKINKNLKQIQRCSTHQNPNAVSSREGGEREIRNHSIEKCFEEFGLS